MKVIAKIKNGFTSKFGIPRQSGLIGEIKSTIVFEPEYQSPEALRGLEEFSHIWLIWEFSENKDKPWSPTVRPPRLGGNKRMGVFSTRSPFRPNPIGLSCVKLDAIRLTKEQGYVLDISGADLMDGTPIYDIKPYLPISDCISDATDGFSKDTKDYELKVNLGKFNDTLDNDLKTELTEILKGNPRPSYQNDENQIYCFAYKGFEIKFKVKENVAYLIDILKDDFNE